MTTRRFAPVLLAVVAAITLPGCGMLVDPTPSTKSAVRQLFDGGSHSDLALNALTAGQLTEAERQALIALRLDPRDPYALYVAGMVYQATGRYDLARQYYQVLIANQPQVTIVVPSQGQPQVRSLVDLAQANLAAIDRLTGRYVPRTIAQSGQVPMIPLAGEPQAPYPGGAEGGFVPGAPVLAQPFPLGGAVASPIEAPAGMNPAEINVSNRFRLLKRLLDEGLITAEEYNRRRSANIGALMPYATSVPPARGLDRPPPDESAVFSRLKSLNNQLEARAVTPAELAAERGMILEALLPSQPRDLELPPAPLHDVMAAASAVGRAERLRGAGLLRPEEAQAERIAIERQLDGPSQFSAAPPPHPAASRRHAARTSSGLGKGTGLGLILAAAPSEDEARTTWQQIKAKYPEELGVLDASFRQSGASSAPRWRVIAGPVKSRNEARRLCKALKLYRQSCEVGAL